MPGASPGQDEGGFPVSVVQGGAGRGRDLVAARGVGRGEVVLRCLPIAAALRDEDLPARCSFCMGAPGDAEGGGAPALAPCANGCGYQLCPGCRASARCTAVHGTECASVRHLARAGEDGPRGTPELRLLIRLMCLRALEAGGRLPDYDECADDVIGDGFDAVEDLCCHLDDADDDVDEDAGEGGGDGGDGGASLREKLEEASYGLAAQARYCIPAEARVSREALAGIVARNCCNGFAIWDSETGRNIGEGLYPSVGVAVNHSCEPNVSYAFEPHNAGAICLRALRDVREGEVLTISYCSLFQGLGARRRFLENSFFFTCHCGRCEREGRGAGPGGAPPRKRARGGTRRVGGDDAEGDGEDARLGAMNDAAARLPALLQAGRWAECREAASWLAEELGRWAGEGAGREWAELDVLRARWAGLRAEEAEEGAAGAGARRARAGELAERLEAALGEGDPFARRARAFARGGGKA